MINIPTCLILGAGASMPYGFPSGKELRKKILDIFSKEQWWKLLHELEFEDEDFINSFRHDFMNSKIFSIDRFLENRSEYLEIGKLAIAFTLIPSEYSHNLLEIDDQPDRWYSILWNKMLTPRLDSQIVRNIKVITFNYDRSLEHFIYSAIKASYPNATENNCVTTLTLLDIIHVYGKLGNLTWQGKPSRPYSPEPTSQQYKIASDQIKIVSEPNLDSNVLDSINMYLESANRIFILGFGFDETNFNRLRIDKISKKKPRDICATSYQLGNAEIKLYESKWPYIKFAKNTLDISMFFKEVITLE